MTAATIGSAPITRVWLRRMLGGFWLLDALLQLQPFMFTRAFATTVLLPSADGQPTWIAAPIREAALLTAQHPVPYNCAFAGVQLALGGGLLFGRIPRVTLAASIAWGIGIWYIGEGLGGLASGHATLITGAPGAAAFYVLLAAAAWPTRRAAMSTAGLPTWLPSAWTAGWLAAGILQLLPAQATAAAVQDALSHEPTALSNTVHVRVEVPNGLGTAGPALIALAFAAIGGAAARAGLLRKLALGVGAGVTVIFWIFGQDAGQLFTGHATDPNTAPLILVLAGAVASVPRRRLPQHAYSMSNAGGKAPTAAARNRLVAPNYVS
ncbi:MAG: hypothetical protein M3N95_12585 [Actinomycetota bacterium]|nr:hypothetical protein [Actinomycetota bacterium]